MAKSAGGKEDNKSKPQEPGAGSAEEFFKKATMLHQEGDIHGALTLYNQIVERFPRSPRAELAKTMIAGIQNEKIRVLWDTASEVRSDCNPEEALRLYNLIGEEFPDSQEATSAKTELSNTAQITEWWNAGLNFQSGGNEAAALDLYKQIVERFPNSPEAANARLLMSIIDQNRFIPKREVAHDLEEKQMTPGQIVSNLLMHKKADTAQKASFPGAAAGEADIKRIDKLWAQALTIEKDGHSDEAAVLYKRIIETSTNGHKVRDAKYRLEKIEAISSYGSAEQWGLKGTATETILRKGRRKKLIAAAAAAFTVLIAGAFFFYPAAQQVSWTDAVDKAKKAVVVVKTTGGAGSGFLVSSDGVIITNASLVGKEKDVEVRLYSGVLRKAGIVKVGTLPLDIAVLKIDGADNHFLSMAGPDECREGEEIRVIGAPQGIEYFITKGIISHCNHERDGIRYLQTDMPIAPGNNGGPCIDKTGKVLGLSTSVRINDGQHFNIVLPITVVKDFMDGKLVALEETLIKKEEERARDLEQKKNQFYTDAEKTYRRLQDIADAELRAYMLKLDNMLRTRSITYEQGKLMAEQAHYPPSGSGTLSQWVQTLSFQVMKGEISEDAAINLIKGHFKR
jgi:tetratricopeptide (TPR) repeat protein